MSSRCRLLVVVSCLAFVCWAGLAPALAQVPGLGNIGRGGANRDRRQQQPKQAQQQLQNLPPLQAAGAVDAVVPGYIRVVSEAGQPLVFQVLPNVRCQVTGKAKAEFLSPGYFIRFVGEVNKRGAVEQKIAKLTVFTPSQSRQPGAEKDQGLGTSFGARPGEEKKAGEGARPAFGAAADAAQPGAGARKPSGGKGGSGPEVFDVRGQIVGVSNGRLSLHVPNIHFKPSLRVEVAEDADIDVELDDPVAYTLARKGDKIRVQGRQGAGNQGFAEELDIVLVEPLGAPQQEGKRHGRGARPRRGAEAEEPAETKPGDGKAEKKPADPSPAKGKKASADGTEEPTPADDGDAAKGTPKKRSKVADRDTPEKPAKKKTKKPKDDASADGSSS